MTILLSGIGGSMAVSFISAGIICLILTIRIAVLLNVNRQNIDRIFIDSPAIRGAGCHRWNWLSSEGGVFYFDVCGNLWDAENGTRGISVEAIQQKGES